MIISNNGRALIKEFEGCKTTAYPDPGSGGAPWTIGYGHTGPEVHPGLVWTQQQCDIALENDIVKVEGPLSASLQGKATTQNQFDAMIDFAFNEGLGHLLSSTLFRKHLAGDYAGAKAEFGKWDLASGHVLAGLQARRAAEANLYGS